MIRNVRPPRESDPIYAIERGPRLASSAAYILVQLAIAVALVIVLGKIFDYFDPPNREGVSVHVTHQVP